MTMIRQAVIDNRKLSDSTFLFGVNRASRPVRRRTLSGQALIAPAGSIRRSSTGSAFDHDFSQIPAITKFPAPIQAKLKVGQPDDEYEREADRVAAQVMRSSEGQSSSSAGTKMPAIGAGRNSLQADGGKPLSDSERNFFEPRFGADFSRVRVHEGTAAAAAARSINARAFTLGNHVVLGAGEYSADTSAGKTLMAHELTHVVQQQGVSEQATIRRQQADVTAVDDISPDPKDEPAATKSSDGSGSTRVDRCYQNPLFPDFRCLIYALKLDIDENLRDNAYQFFRTATLFPDDGERMWNTFLRYGLGVNLLQTSFGFLGADETLGTALSYGTGIGLKTYAFLQKGELELDLPIPLGSGVRLDLQLDLNADPEDLTDVKRASAGVGISGHF